MSDYCDFCGCKIDPPQITPVRLILCARCAAERERRRQHYLASERELEIRALERPDAFEEE